MNPRELFTVERSTWDRHKEELLRDHEGKFALIKGDEVLGVFDDEIDAADAGFRRAGRVPFLVQPIERVEEVIRLHDVEIEL